MLFYILTLSDTLHCFLLPLKLQIGNLRIGEGDCDWDSDCLYGLDCDSDWWWNTDYCVAGSTMLLHLNHDLFEYSNFDYWRIITLIEIYVQDLTLGMPTGHPGEVGMIVLKHAVATE